MRWPLISVFLSALALLVVLSACARPTTPCMEWPVHEGPIDIPVLLDLTAQGKLAHADCKARYDMSRASRR